MKKLMAIAAVALFTVSMNVNAQEQKPKDKKECCSAKGKDTKKAACCSADKATANAEKKACCSKDAKKA